MAKRAVIVVAAGKGLRMAAHIPKQFLELHNKPILFHTLEAFYAFDNTIQIILVLHESFQDYWIRLVQDSQFPVDHMVITGGKERFHSVKNGLKALDAEVEMVAVHDAVRPLVSQETLHSVFACAAEKGCAIPALPVVDSLRKGSLENNRAVSREDMYIVQTPQVFQKSLIKDAYKQNFDPSFTDDASVLESTNQQIFLCAGNPENIKITTREDLAYAEFVLAKK